MLINACSFKVFHIDVHTVKLTEPLLNTHTFTHLYIITTQLAAVALLAAEYIIFVIFQLGPACMCCSSIDFSDVGDACRCYSVFENLAFLDTPSDH